MKRINIEWVSVKSHPAFVALSLGLYMTCTTVLANNFTIDIDDKDIAVEATNASLKELLQEVQNLTGIPVRFVADTDERVTLSVGMTTIENAISKITPNHMIVHENQNGKDVIKELIIIPAVSDLSTGGSGSAFLPNGNPAPAIEESQVSESPMTPSQADPNQPPVQPAVQPADEQPAPEGQVN